MNYDLPTAADYANANADAARRGNERLARENEGLRETVARHDRELIELRRVIFALANK